MSEKKILKSCQSCKFSKWDENSKPKVGTCTYQVILPPLPNAARVYNDKVYIRPKDGKTCPVFAVA